MANVKGTAFSSRLLWVRLNHGQEGFERLVAAVEAPLCQVLREGAVMSKWYPFEQFVELNLVIDRLWGRGDLSLVKTLGRHGADANLTTIYRLFYKVGTVKWILARASRLWGMHYDSGNLYVDLYPGREVGLRIEDFETPHRAHCLAVLGWAERSIELSGGTDVKAAEVACRTRGGPMCRFRASWR